MAATAKPEAPTTEPPKPEPSTPKTETATTNTTTKLTAANVAEIWVQAASTLGDVTADMAGQYTEVRLNNNQVIVTFAEKHICEYCRKVDRMESLRSALAKLSGDDINLQFQFEEKAESQSEIKKPKLTRVQMMRKIEQNELVKSAMKVFDAEVVDFRNLGKKAD